MQIEGVTYFAKRKAKFVTIEIMKVSDENLNGLGEEIDRISEKNSIIRH